MTKINMKDFVKIIGLVSTVVSIGASLLESYSTDKKLEKMVDDKVSERLRLAEKDDEEDEEE